MVNLWIAALAAAAGLIALFAWGNRATAKTHARFTARDVEEALATIIEHGPHHDEWAFLSWPIDDPYLESTRQECGKIDKEGPPEAMEERLAALLADFRRRMRTTALLLPEPVRRKAAVGFGGEHAWRQHDVAEVFRQARASGLACLGGKVQFQFREGTCDAHWLTFDPEFQGKGESWPDYVSRSADEALDAFRRLCRRTDFRAVARDWTFVRDKMDRESYDPLGDLWFVLYFATEHPVLHQQR